MLRVEYTPLALSQLTVIRAYLEDRAPSAMARAAEVIAAATRVLAEHPYSGRRQEDPEVRKAVTSDGRYLLFYTVLDDQIVRILSVFDSRQQRPYRDA